MADEAQRGVIFILKARTDDSIGREFSRVSELAAAAQKRFDSMHLGPLETGAFETSLTRASNGYHQNVTRMNGQKVGPKADTSGWDKLTAAGKAAFDNHTKWSQGMERLAAQRAAGEKAAADEAIANAERVKQARANAWRDLSEQGRAGSKAAGAADPFGRGLENISKGNTREAAAAEREADKQRAQEVAEANREIARLQKQADREQRQEDQRRMTERRELARNNDRETKEFLRQQAREQAEAQREAARQERTNPTTGWAGLSAAGRAAGERGSAHQEGIDAWEKGQKRLENQRKKAADEAKRDLAEQREKYNRLNESIGATVDGVTRLGEGMAYLGLIGQRDLGRLTDSLLAVRGTVDAIRGGVGMLRDAGGLMRNLREVGGGEGGGGARAIGRAFLGLGPAAAGTGAAGGVGMGGAGAAIGGTAALAPGLMAGLGIAVAAGLAHVASGGNTTRMLGERMGEAGLGAARASHSIGRFFRRLGMGHGEQLQEDWEEKYGPQEDPFATDKNRAASGFLRGGFGKKSAFTMAEESERNLARQQAREERRRRAGDAQAVTFEYNTTAAQQAMEARQSARAASFNRQALDTQVDANSRPWEIQAGRQRAMALRMQEHQENLAEAEAERRRTGEQLRGAAPGPGRDAAAKIHEEAERRVVEMRQRSLELAREQRTVDIDGARQRLQIMRDQLTLVQEQRRAARGESQSLFERIGAMDPIQRQALAAAQRRVKSGDATIQDERLVADSGSQEGQEAVRAARIRRGRGFSEDDIKGGGSLGEREIGQEISARGNERNRRGRLNEGIERERERDKGLDVNTTVDNRITINIKANDNFYSNLEQQYTSSMQSFLTDQNSRVQKWIEEAQTRFEETMNNAMAQQNQQGRQNAGGGAF